MRALLRHLWRTPPAVTTCAEAAEVDQPELTEPVEPSPDPDPANLAAILSDLSIAPLLREVDARLPATPPHEVPALFRRVPLEVLVLISVFRPAELPNICGWLPAMPPEEVQFGSTGTTGLVTMTQAAAFVSAASRFYESVRGALQDAYVLDYGICWGRLAALFQKYVRVDRLHGVDAWLTNLHLARDAGFRGPLALVYEIPHAVPFDVEFDLVYAFSVLTHLDRNAADAIVAAIRRSMKDGGLFAVSIRPSEFWRLLGEDERESHKLAVETGGYAFTPDRNMPDTAPSGYGNATYTVDFIKHNWTGFSVLGVEYSLLDPAQLYVFLQAC